MKRWRVHLAMAAALAAVLAAVPAARGAVTDQAVGKAIEQGVQYIIKQQKPDGTWGEKKYAHTQQEVGNSELALMTLLYVGEHPNREYVSKALDALINRNLDYTYAVAVRAIALATVQNKLIEQKRDTVRAALKRDVAWLVATQGPKGGWGYTGGATGDRPSQSYEDLSNTQMAILALREAALAGIEIPRATWARAQEKYFRCQKTDGSWSYIEGDGDAGYGSMTAAGLASIFITLDNLDLASGCPCRAGRSARPDAEIERRLDKALEWLEKQFKADKNPPAGQRRESRVFYWLYSVERVGSAAGYKYFGGHDWFKEAADWLIKKQEKNGSWKGPYGDLVSTCFATLFLFKGRGPILYNKLQFEGEWNNHRRDVANLVQFISKIKEQPCHWQIVNLKGPVSELHDAPVLFITPESLPQFSDADKKKLREFTDTGGTILFEASCGNPAVRRWFQDFAKEVWPEWPVGPLGSDHPVYTDPYRLRARPEIMGIDDGIRTFLFFAPDDISCQWQTKALTARGYMFEWGINLVACATDSAPLRAKLAERDPKTEDRYKAAVKAGSRTTLRLARVRYGGNWDVGVRYKGARRLADRVKSKAGVTLEVREEGMAAAGLSGCDIGFFTGSRAFDLKGEEVAGLKAFAAKGGLLWFEAAAGSLAFNQSMHKLAEQAGWQLKLLAKDHPLMTGRLGAATGHDLTKGVQFRRALKVQRTGRAEAELYGVFDSGKMVGVYSIFDTMFAITPYEAALCRGYESQDAGAVATNLVLYATAHGK